MHLSINFATFLRALQFSLASAYIPALMHTPLQRAACHAKKFVLHFEAPISLLRAIEVDPDADFIRRHFICM